MMRMFGIGTRRAMLPAQPFTAEQEARIIRMIAVALNAHDAEPGSYRRHTRRCITQVVL
jgi:hypothetical protein